MTYLTIRRGARGLRGSSGLLARCAECGMDVETVIDLAEPPDPAELSLATLVFGLSATGKIDDTMELRPCGHRVEGVQ